MQVPWNMWAAQFKCERAVQPKSRLKCLVCSDSLDLDRTVNYDNYTGLTDQGMCEVRQKVYHYHSVEEDQHR